MMCLLLLSISWHGFRKSGGKQKYWKFAFSIIKLFFKVGISASHLVLFTMAASKVLGLCSTLFYRLDSNLEEWFLYEYKRCSSTLHPTQNVFHQHIWKKIRSERGPNVNPSVSIACVGKELWSWGSFILFFFC